MDPASCPHPLPEELRLALGNLRARFRMTGFAICAALVVGALAIVFLLAFVLDRLGDTPATTRAGLLVGGAVLCAALMLWFGLRWFMHRSFLQISGLVEKTMPTLGDRIRGAVELAGHVEKPGQSPELTDAALGQVSRETVEKDLGSCVSHMPMWRAVGIGGAPLALALLASVLAFPAAENTFARLINPFSKIPRFTFTQLEPVSETLVVARGEPFTFRATLVENSPWIPTRGTVRSGNGLPDITTASQNGRFDFNLPPLLDDAIVQLRIGDARHDIEIKPAYRPRVIGLAVDIQLPAYLEKSKLTQIPEAARLRVVEGSTCVVTGSASRPLASVSDGVHSGSWEIKAESFASPPLKIESGKEIPLQLRCRDIDGLESRAIANLKLVPVADQPPAPALYSEESVIAVLETEPLALTLNARDDFGVQEMGVAWKAVGQSESESIGSASVVRGAPDSESLAAPVVFRPVDHGIVPGPLEIMAFAIDYKPGRPRIYSVARTMHVLDKVEHARWVEAEFSRVESQLEEVVRQEENLRSANKQLQEQDLAEPLNAEKLAESADAEMKNAHKLDDTRRRGEELFNRALRNDSIDAEAMNKWSEMLADMKEIARENMPAAAESLQSAARQARAGQTAAARQQLDEAVQKQDEIIAKLGETQGKAAETREWLEAGTFVHRLRRASQTESKVGKGLLELIREDAGRTPDQLESDAREILGALSHKQSVAFVDCRNIFDDLGHYVQRSANEPFQRVYSAMNENGFVEGLDDLTRRVALNQAVRSHIASLSWAEKLAQWAQWLSPEQEEQSGENGEGSSSSSEQDPDILVRIMRAVQSEMEIREETRRLETTRDTDPAYAENSRMLAVRQREVGADLEELARDYPLPPLTRMVALCDPAVTDAANLLSQPSTGGPTIAAETEIIEILAESAEGMQSGATKSKGQLESMMQMMRTQISQQSGGYKGGSESDVSKEVVEGDAQSSSKGEDRTVDKTSGQSLNQLPEEYRGLFGDYFEAVEKLRTGSQQSETDGRNQ